MNYKLRLADNAATYPLPVDARAEWRAAKDGWETRISLPEVATDHIIVPSYASLAHAVPHQFSLLADSGSDPCVLDPVPAARASARPEAEFRRTPDYEAHIDCWHTRSTSRPTLMLNVAGREKPERYLLTVGIRPLSMPSDALLDTTELAAVQRTPQAISQMEAPAGIARRICSPTALAMALSTSERPVPWPLAVRACFDPITRAYGSWPLAVRWAAMNGRLGAVETLWDTQEAAAVLRQDIPLVCSVDYPSAALPNAPLNQTAGHLVVLAALSDDACRVFDPAAPDHGTVDRQYDRAAFLEAWLRRRGAAYIFGRLCD